MIVDYFRTAFAALMPPTTCAQLWTLTSGGASSETSPVVRNNSNLLIMIVN